MIPKSFKIANQEITVKLLDIDSKNRYGYWNDANNTICVFKNVKADDEKIELSEETILNSFYHELVHCFQFYYNNVYDEGEAQVFANFIREFQSTKK